MADSDEGIGLRLRELGTRIRGGTGLRERVHSVVDVPWANLWSFSSVRSSFDLERYVVMMSFAFSVMMMVFLSG